MSEDHQNAAADNAGSAGMPSAMSSSRRRLLRGGLAATPILMTVVSRPVMATGTCAPASSYASINASKPGDKPPVSCHGKSPGYWKQPHHFKHWPAGYEPETKKYLKATLFSDAVGPGYPGLTLLQLLDESSGGGDRSVARELVAALLSAASGHTTGVLTVQGVKDIWHEFYSKKSYSPTAGAEPWDGEDIKDWISSTRYG